MDYGCFVKIEEGIEGLIHNSELDWTNRNIKPSKVLSVSQKIKFKVVNIDKDSKRISLSYKAILDNPWDKVKEKIGNEVKIKINNVTDKAIFGELVDLGLTGMLHYKEISYEENIEDLLEGNDVKLLEAISKSIEIKAEVVSQDETEQGIRKWLNFGHTFGHAIEASKNYKGILHGEAISVGMNIASAISADQGYLTHDEYCNIEDMLLNMQMPTMIPKKITSASIMKHIGHDKKKISGKNRFILLDKIGNAYIDDKLDNKYLKEISKNFIR